VAAGDQIVLDRKLREDVLGLRHAADAGRATHEIIAAGVGFVPQTENVFAQLSIEHNLVAGGHTLPRPVLKERLEEAFERFPALAERRRAAPKAASPC
jgi:ABC-type branched-subunit amino acid transport system ATPase component